MKTDIEIAREVIPEHILKIAERANIDEKYIEEMRKNYLE